MADAESVELIKVGSDVRLLLTARRTQNGNLSFEYAGIRHIVKPDGQVLHRIRYASGGGTWEPSPSLSLAELKC